MKKFTLTAVLGLGLGVTQVAPLLAQTESATTTTTTTTTSTAPTTATAPLNVETTTLATPTASPYGFILESYTQTGRRGETETNISKFNTTLTPLLTYTVVPGSVFSIYPQFEAKRDDKTTTTHYVAQSNFLALKFAQNAILTEARNGVDFAADARFYSYISRNSKTEMEGSNRFQVRTYLTKNFTDKVKVYNENRFGFLDRNGTYTNAKTKYSNYDVNVTPSYNFNNKWEAGTELHYYDNKANVTGQTLFVFAPLTTYRFSDALSVTGQVELLRLDSLDEKTFARHEMEMTATVLYGLSSNVTAEFEATAPALADGGGFIGTEISDKMNFGLTLTMVGF
jgi:hypothetical protein